MRYLLRSFVLGFFVFVLASPAMAQEATVNCAAKGDYLGANGAIFYDGAVLQCDASHSWKKGFFLGIWASTAGNTDLEFDKEVDLFGGYSGTFGKLRYTADAAHFAVQGIDVANLNFEVGIGLAFTRIEGYTPVQRGGPRKGLILSTGARLNKSLANKLSVSASGAIKHDSGAFGFDEAWLVQGYYGISLAATDKTTFVLGARWSSPITTVDDGRKTEVVWEVGLSRKLR